MRALREILILTAATVAWTHDASADRTRSLGVERSLTAADIEYYAAPYLPAIKACYVEHGRPAPGSTGELALNLAIHRDGGITGVTIEAPGVRGRWLRELTRCVRTQVATWHFPVRRDPTTAILPYYFLHLNIRGAGPQPSCWNPRGCATKPTPRERTEAAR